MILNYKIGNKISRYCYVTNDSKTKISLKTKQFSACYRSNICYELFNQLENNHFTVSIIITYVQLAGRETGHQSKVKENEDDIGMHRCIF